MCEPTQADWPIIMELILWTNFLVKVGLQPFILLVNIREYFREYIQHNVYFNISYELFPEIVNFCDRVNIETDVFQRQLQTSEDVINAIIYCGNDDEVITYNNKLILYDITDDSIINYKKKYMRKNKHKKSHVTINNIRRRRAQQRDAERRWCRVTKQSLVEPE